ncbi:ArsR/SmtB family transcription factor [Rhizobium mongolense]
MTNELEVATAIAKMLADPLRLQMLQCLTWGPCSVAQLIEATGTSQSNVSNHLRRLRAHGLVEAEKNGRIVIYRVASPTIAEVIASLSWAATGSRTMTTMHTPDALRQARTCYDHLAGRIGVQIMQGLIGYGALTEPAFPWDDVRIGPNARDAFNRLELDYGTHEETPSHRRLAFACPDWSEHHQFHLGGHLGAALCRHLLAKTWIQRDADRSVTVTAAGKQALAWLTGQE